MYDSLLSRIVVVRSARKNRKKSISEGVFQHYFTIWKLALIFFVFLFKSRDLEMSLFVRDFITRLLFFQESMKVSGEPKPKV